MKVVMVMSLLVLTGLLAAGCGSIPVDDADERPWNGTAGGWLQDRDAADDDR